MIRIAQWNINILYTFGADERGPAARQYEERVRIVVNAIMRTRTGAALLGTFNANRNKEAAIWIMNNQDTSNWCNSATGNFLSTDPSTGKDDWEGSRIWYSPDRYAVDDCGWYPGMRPEDVLFHEMVHASRNLNDPVYDNTPLYLMGDYEEFLAVLITNMYRTEIGAKKLHRDYVLKLLVEQPEAEAFLSSKREYLDAIQALQGDLLVSAVSGLNTPFNPFRDYDRLDANYSRIRELWDSTPFAKMVEAERIKAIGKKLFDEQQQMSIDSSARMMRGH
jgi:Effector protein